MNRATLALIVILATACARSTAASGDIGTRVTLTTDRQSYGPGDTVHVTLTNDSDRDAGYNLCNRSLEHRTSQTWEQVQHFPELPNVCTMPLFLLSPGKSARVDATIPASAAAGSYRFTFPGAPPEARTTNEFAIESR